MLAPGDFNGDDKPDLLVRRADGALLLYRGNGAGGWLTGMGEPIGSGWEAFTALLSPGDFTGDGKPDVLARRPDGGLLLYRGDGAGGWLTGTGEQIGSGWQPFTAILPGGDFSGDGKPDVLARAVRRRPAAVPRRRSRRMADRHRGADRLRLAGVHGAHLRRRLQRRRQARRARAAVRRRLLMYRGNGASGWLTGTGEPIGSGWGSLAA